MQIHQADGSICSAGFNAVSRADGLPYVMTPGHCDDGGGNWRTRFADGPKHVIGAFHNSEDTPFADVGIIRVNNPAGWRFGRPWVTVDPTGGEPARQNYVIKDVVAPGMGDRVCATLGNSTRTDCGGVLSLGQGLNGLFQVTGLCTEGGDSGSPYFAFHAAYGIHVAGDDVRGTTVGCEYGLADKAIVAQDRMNINIITA